MLDLHKSDLLLGLEFNRLGNVVFLRRASSSVPGLRKVHATIEEALEAGSRIGQMHADGAVLDLATVAVILPRSTDGMRAASCESLIRRPSQSLARGHDREQ